jgi:hypothetical protein
LEDSGDALRKRNINNDGGDNVSDGGGGSGGGDDGGDGNDGGDGSEGGDGGGDGDCDNDGDCSEGGDGDSGVARKGRPEKKQTGLCSDDETRGGDVNAERENLKN